MATSGLSALPASRCEPGAPEGAAGLPGVSGCSDGLHLAQGRETAKRVELDLAHALAREAEAPADLLERLRLGLVQAVAQLEHLPLALGQRGERLVERLAAKRDFDLVLR